MVSTSVKDHSKTPFPKSFSFSIASVAGLTVFLFLASFLLISRPVGVDKVDRREAVVSVLTSVEQNSSVETEVKDGSSGGVPSGDSVKDGNLDGVSSGDTVKDDTSFKVEQNFSVETEVKDGSPGGVPSGDSVKDGNSSVSSGDSVKDDTSFKVANRSETDQTNLECDLYRGKWFHDSAGPLYTNNSCPVITQMQNCQGNGRPDKDYENWRWKPNQCDLPRFDPRRFLELMKGKTLAFIGDSVARNQMESLLCLLWQVEEPKNRGNKKMHRYYFRSTSTMIVRIWSSWLVDQNTDPVDFAPANVTKLHLDIPDKGFMEFIKDFHVIIFSSGHWFAKQSAYVLNNEIVGGQLWWPDKKKKMKINNIDAYGISVETILTAMVTDPDYSGLSIVRSYSPDHYEGGEWNTGGSCTGKDKPALDSELVENAFTNIMHEKQVTGFNQAAKKQTNKSKLKLMDITPVFSYRHDGHPGPYRSPDPNKITKRGPDGKPPPQDCLHWCMPGPVDTWNEFVFELIRQEYEHSEHTS